MVHRHISRYKFIFTLVLECPFKQEMDIECRQNIAMIITLIQMEYVSEGHRKYTGSPNDYIIDMKNEGGYINSTSMTITVIFTGINCE